jgi:THO complex subunit 4
VSVLRKCFFFLCEKAVSNATNSQPKSQPKSAAATKSASTGSGARGKGNRGRGRGGRNARPAKKTAEELDSEMADYFETGANAPAATTAPAANGDAAMDDEIMVCILDDSNTEVY